MNSKLPIGIQDFAKLRTEGYKYIDKSEIIYRLAKSGCYYFLSRPRRFGKSLFLSTLEAYFLGRKDLFSGLEIDSMEKDWIEYPVLHLDLNTQKYENLDALDYILNDFLQKRRSQVWFDVPKQILWPKILCCHSKGLRAFWEASGHPCGRIRQTCPASNRQQCSPG